MEYANMYPRDTSASVTNASSVILEANMNRSSWLVTNTSTAGVIISLARGQAAVANKGITLQPNESYYETTDVFPCWRGYISAIGSAAGPTTVAISETIAGD